LYYFKCHVESIDRGLPSVFLGRQLNVAIATEVKRLKIMDVFFKNMLTKFG
jgi:hypothetical protein